LFLAAAILLAFERIAYVWVWRYPRSFTAFCAFFSEEPQAPVVILERMFNGFKVIQISVFLAWCYFHPNRPLWLYGNLVPLTAGATLVIIGQVLNLSVFYRLGSVGVFYGNRFGYEVPWCTEFPFSLMDHPQYVGALLSIWGLFLALQFPRPDWYAIPALESLYYALGAYLER
jgi:phosphatidyl-N-methylethanolamine N-methyltransferase